MSYDIGLLVPRLVDVLDWNYTSNCASMWRAAGVDFQTWGDKQAWEVIPELEAAITRLKADPAYYKTMNPENGWGSYDSLIVALEKMLVVLHDNTLGHIKVCC